MISNIHNDSDYVLVTGGTGFIGKSIVKDLRSKGRKVISISRSEGIKADHLSVDLINLHALKRAAQKLPKIKTIIHCAAIAHGQKPPKDYSVSQFNSLMLKNLLEVFCKVIDEWIFISSISVYGDVNYMKEIPILLSPLPIDDYGIGKLQDENMIKSNCKNYNIIRLPPVYSDTNFLDIKKRVYFPKTNLKLIIKPSPKYSICSIDSVLIEINKCLKLKYGQRLIQIADKYPVSQKELASWFPGKSIVLPQIFLKFAYNILPKNILFFKKIRFLINKIGFNNIYMTGTLDIEEEFSK